MRTVISTKNAPGAIGPYSQAIHTSASETLYISGQIGFDPTTTLLVSEHVADQTRQALKNLEAIIVASGFSKENVVKTTIFLKNMNDFGTVNEIYSAFFEGIAPARSTVEVARLPRDALFEVEAIASR